MFNNRHCLGAGVAALATLSIGLTMSAPAKATLPSASLTTEQFSTDLGFTDLKSMKLLEPSPTLETVKGLVKGERNALSQSFLSQYQLNASNLFWNGVDPVEVYFINEGAGYRNQLLYTATNGNGDLVKSEMIFADVSSPDSILSNKDGPLALGQGVSLGKFSGPTQLGFSIISDGFNLKQPKMPAQANLVKPDEPKANATSQEMKKYKQELEKYNKEMDKYAKEIDKYNQEMEKYNAEVARRTLGADIAKNVDGKQHLVAFQHENWTILGFEDIIGGGDLDYNDVVFAVRGVQEGQPEDVPEPSALLSLLVLGVAGFTSLRRQQPTED